MFSNFSSLEQGVDTAFVVILSIIFFFLIGLTILLIVFIIRYNEKKNPVAKQIEGNNKLEILWTVIPLLLVVAMFYFGWTGWRPVYSDPPEDAMPVTVTARMWTWSITYENGKRMDTLYVPEGKPVVLDLVALDVIHSFYVPAFRLKMDMIPGKDISTWFIANSPGVFDIFCAEYCGLEHSNMYTAVKVMTQEDFNSWYADTTEVPVTDVAISPAVAGRTVYQSMGCIACHSTDGSVITGPSFRGIYGEEVSVITGGNERIQTVDDNYIRKSILDPNSDVVDGFNPNLMQSYSDLLSDEEISQIIEFIKSLE